MTVQEFKEQWDAAHREEGNWLRNIRKLCTNEWIYGDYNGHILLVRCKGYFDASEGVIKMAKSYDKKEGKNKPRLVPMLERWFIVQKDGRRELWSCYRVRGADKDDHGTPFKMLYDIGNFTPHQVISLIQDGSYVNWAQHSDRAPKTYIKKERYGLGTVKSGDISAKHDGENIALVMLKYPKWNYNGILNRILHEGGSVDSNGIIHKK